MSVCEGKSAVLGVVLREEEKIDPVVGVPELTADAKPPKIDLGVDCSVAGFVTPPRSVPPDDCFSAVTKLLIENGDALLSVFPVPAVDNDPKRLFTF